MVPPDDFAGAYCRYDGRRRSWWLERIDLVQNALLHARFDEYNIEWRELMDSFRMLTINPFSPEYLEYKKELASITPKTITDAATEILEFTLNQIEKEK